MNGNTAADLGIGFDFDHTLGTDHGLERSAFYLLAAECGVRLDPHDAPARAKIDGLLAEFRSDDISLDEAVMNFLAMFVLAYPHPEPSAPERYRELCYSLVGRVEPIPGARALLAEIERRGIRVAILTNGWTPLQQKKIASVGFGGTILVSDALGYSKPAPQAFERLAEVLGVAAERCWYVGDNPRADIGGALAAGMRAVWLDLGEHEYPRDVAPPSLRITSLEELIRELPAGAVSGALASGTDGRA